MQPFQKEVHVFLHSLQATCHEKDLPMLKTITDITLTAIGAVHYFGESPQSFMQAIDRTVPPEVTRLPRFKHELYGR